MAVKLSKKDADRFTRILLEDMVTTALLRGGRPLRTAELLSAMTDGAQISRALLRLELGESERVVTAERRWDLTSRIGAARRPIEGLVDSTLRLVGKPLALPLLAREVAVVRGDHIESVRHFLGRLLADRPKYVPLSNNLYALEDWLLDVRAETEADVIFENMLEQEEDIASLLQEVDVKDLTRSGQEADWCVKILDVVGRPLSQRVLSFLVWKGRPQQFDAVSLLDTLATNEKFSYLCGGYVCLGETLAELKRELSRRSARAEREAGEEVSVADIDALLRRRVAREEMARLRPEELEEIKRYMRQTQSPVSLAFVMTDLFEMSPDDKAFVPTLHALAEEMRSDREFTPVGKDRWFLRELIPPQIHDVPILLTPIHLDLRTLEDEPIDVLLTDDGLDGDLPAIVRAPEWEDIGEEAEVERLTKTKMTGDRLTYTVLYHHFKAGTMKLRKMDEEFFPPDVNIARLVFVDDAYGEIPVWLNRETGLLYGFKDWYNTRLTPAGSIFTVERTDDPDRYIIRSIDTRNSPAYIDPNRLKDLQSLAERAENASMPVFEILQELMQEHHSGVEFITLWSEMNVVRRTAKRLLASILSGYHCFYARQRGKNWLWRFDENRVDQGFMRQKRKFVRR
ncbi:MAG: hypothetical protein RMK49_17295 [Abditibacteriales bacterium]|nr:hypothetical protein [Abditibacteriales bacterium]